MPVYRAKIAVGGRLIVPAELRRRLGLHSGSTVILDLSEELIQERREEAAHHASSRNAARQGSMPA